MDRKVRNEKDYNNLGMKLIIAGFVLVSITLIIVEFTVSPLAGIFILGMLLIIAGYRTRSFSNRKQ